MDRERYDLLDAYMRKRMRGADGAHDCEHVYRVLGVALDVAASEPEADVDVVCSTTSPGAINCAISASVTQRWERKRRKSFS